MSIMVAMFVILFYLQSFVCLSKHFFFVFAAS